MFTKNTFIFTFFLVLASVSSFGNIDQGETPEVSTVCEPPNPHDGIGASRAKYICEVEVYLPLVQAALLETETSEQDQAKILNNLRRTIGKKYSDYLGPTYEKLSAQGKKDAQIIKSATRTGGKDLFLDNQAAIAVLDFVNQYELGTSD